MADTLGTALIAASNQDGLRLRSAIVDGTGPLTITLGGATGIPATRLASYTPTISDPVAVIQSEGRVVVLGKET